MRASVLPVRYVSEGVCEGPSGRPQTPLFLTTAECTTHLGFMGTTIIFNISGIFVEFSFRCLIFATGGKCDHDRVTSPTYFFYADFFIFVPIPSIIGKLPDETGTK